MAVNRQITRNAAVNFVAWQLSRHGWIVEHRVHGTRGFELHIENADKTHSFSIQPRGLSNNRVDVGLGSGDLHNLPSDWWVVAVDVYTDRPTCYVLNRSEVMQLAWTKDRDGQKWLPWKKYAVEEYREAWHRIGDGRG